MAERFVDPGSDLYELAAQPIDVVCPRCSLHATNAPVPDGRASSSGALRRPRRLTCGHCGYSASWPTGGVARTALGGPIDPFFGARLWLTARCCGANTLWALNAAHLDLLEGYVAAKLRERPVGPGGMTLVARLPAWVKSAKNRDGILAAIRRLRGTLSS